MSNQLEWAKDYVKRVGALNASGMVVATGGMALELYNLAKAIIEDAAPTQQEQTDV